MTRGWRDLLREDVPTEMMRQMVGLLVSARRSMHTPTTPRTPNVMTHYLGPDRPLTELSTWDQVSAAADGGLLGENQWCELKKGIGPSGDKTNLELARDLASLSVHGGVLIFGIVDKTYEVTGCDTSGMRDRISQVASMRISPPLVPIILDDIRGPEGPSLLIVSVPPSPLAPHMVDGQYYGRSAEGKRVLADPEVRALILARERGLAEFTSTLESMPATDPLADIVEGGPSGHGHAYFRAEPCAPIHTGDIDANDFQKLLVNLGRERRDGSTMLLNGCTYRGNDPDGISYRSGADTVTSAYEHREAHVCIHDGHAITAVSGGATRMMDRPNDTRLIALSGTIARFAAQYLELVREVSLRSGYQGEWRVGVHLTGLRGSSRPGTDLYGALPEFPHDTSTNVRVIQPTAWTEPGREIEKHAVLLLTRFHRGLGIDGWSYDRVVQSA